VYFVCDESLIIHIGLWQQFSTENINVSDITSFVIHISALRVSFSVSVVSVWYIPAELRCVYM